MDHMLIGIPLWAVLACNKLLDLFKDASLLVKPCISMYPSLSNHFPINFGFSVYQLFSYIQSFVGVIWYPKIFFFYVLE
jgi:hypothetical protein